MSEEIGTRYDTMRQLQERVKNRAFCGVEAGVHVRLRIQDVECSVQQGKNVDLQRLGFSKNATLLYE